uniref:HMG box domain-containing protein n=1 Tax=Noctiluca scintillans TaxID=2966 RepID=A0A7S1AZH4_NOCSC|mmetsp:Transcript_6870/g.18995  ORF Transcript_6870/g.18995 Transcript_6870/m.18995 type:complete len:197 (+) Transcript_6870:99-689(+)
MVCIQEPKRPQNAYWLFLNEKRPEFEQQAGTKLAPMVGKLAGQAWKELPSPARERYEKKAVELKATYDDELKTFLAAGGEKSKRKASNTDKGAKRAKKEKDPNCPKRPQNAYWLFLTERRDAFVKEAGSAGAPAVAKVAGNAWKHLSEQERQPYERQAASLKERYDQELKKYKDANGSAAEVGGDEESDGEDAVSN